MCRSKLTSQRKSVVNAENENAWLIKTMTTLSILEKCDVTRLCHGNKSTRLKKQKEVNNEQGHAVSDSVRARARVCVCVCVRACVCVCVRARVCVCVSIRQMRRAVCSVSEFLSVCSRG